MYLSQRGDALKRTNEDCKGKRISIFKHTHSHTHVHAHAHRQQMKENCSQGVRTTQAPRRYRNGHPLQSIVMTLFLYYRCDMSDIIFLCHIIFILSL